MSRPDSAAAGQVRAHDDVLGYLLKHAHLALEERAEAVLADAGAAALRQALRTVLSENGHA